MRDSHVEGYSKTTSAHYLASLEPIMGSRMRYLLISMRPEQWVKNSFIFAGLIFSRNLFHAELLLKVSVGFFLFSLAASSIYIFNDIYDIEKDRQHPEKCKRPLAAGKLTIGSAYWASILLATCTLGMAFLLDRDFFAILAGYLAMNLAYTLKLKDVVILDVMCIAFGFVIRVFAGTVLAAVIPSEWLIVCAITISLFLGLSKRRHELVSIGLNANNHRKVLAHYSIPFLDQMIAMATACAFMSYGLYTVADDTIARFGTKNLVFTIPFVLYGVFRYLYLMHQEGKGGNPTNTVLRDLPLLLNGLLWLLSLVIILY